MAIATGMWDPFECVLRQIGIDDAEFTAPGGNGRVHVYQYEGHGLGAPVPRGDELVREPATLGRYDVVLLPCDNEDMKFLPHQKNLQDYTGRGGRLFLTDYSYSWLKDGGPFEGNAHWIEPVFEGNEFTALVDQGFPKGMAFAQWLKVVGASTVLGQLTIRDLYGGASYVDNLIAPAQRWLYTERVHKTVQHFTFNTPVGAAPDKQCGRVVYSTFHVAEDDAGGIIPGLTPFPESCPPKPMTPQEKALEFMLFDASACILPDNEPPRVFEPPPPAPPPPPPQVE
jgi:hypothetical protein